jgi:hypothetical protein
MIMSELEKLDEILVVNTMIESTLLIERICQVQAHIEEKDMTGIMSRLVSISERSGVVYNAMDANEFKDKKNNIHIAATNKYFGDMEAFLFQVDRFLNDVEGKANVTV